MANDKTVSTLYLQALFDYLENKGFDIDPLKAYVPNNECDSEEARLDALSFQKIINQAEKLANDPLLGLHAGENVKPGYYGPLGYIAMSCKTLGEAMQMHHRYQQLVSNHGIMTLEADDKQVRIIWQPQIDDVSRHVVENIFSAWACFGRWICGKDVEPLEVTFQHASPGYDEEYQRIFSGPIKFGHKLNSIAIPKHYLDFPLVQASAELTQYFENKAKVLVKKLKLEDDTLLQALKTWMTQALLTGGLSLESAAQHFELTPRSFQRKLAQKDQSYKTMLDGIRKEIALQQIQQESTNLVELSFMLGFADQPSFQRAFKRWTGTTPGRLRRTEN